ncbi:hypothetical protein [Leisingera sp. M523]|uniref:hypothetical protein n=1 Tax=Leisingera sp. M523 TaxID=2867013 RepID=UPI0021A8EB73|nr:hypothetical protein [Leisingera sp. M523]UWQ30211.1 hypothetical protein K3557_06655 [Leisingera sp. M523]
MKPRPVANYGETKLSMEDRFRARMLMAQKMPAPRQEPNSSPQGYSPEEHRQIRDKTIEVADGKWLSSFTIARRVGAERSVVGSKISELVRQGVMIAKGPRGKRLYKKNPKKTESRCRDERLKERTELVGKIVADQPGVTRSEVVKATGLTKGQVETSLETLFKLALVRREIGPKGRAFRYFPAEVEGKET